MLRNKILAISPHTDDELFGFGGTLLKVKNNAQIKLAVMSCSQRFLGHLGRPITEEEQWGEFSECAKHISTEQPVKFQAEDRLELVPTYKIVRWLDQLIADFQPTTLLIPEPSYHQEHKLVYETCIAACRPTFGNKSIKNIYLYEIPTSTWCGPDGIYKPNVYVDITGQVEEKISLFKNVYKLQYTEEKRNMLGERGIKAHAKYRGLEAGHEYAESFMLIRSTDHL